MAYRRVRRRAPRRRRYRRRRFMGRRRRRGLRMSVRRFPMLFPDALKVPLRYSELRVMSTTLSSGVFTDYFSINNVSDPATLGSETPRYWSTYIGLYNKCYCSGSSIFIQPISNGTNYVGEFCVYPHQVANAAGSDFDMACEMRYARRRGMGGTNSNTARLSSIRHRMSLSKIFGRVPQGVNWEISSSSGPSLAAHWNVIGQLTDTTDRDYYFRVTIIYWCRFYRLAAISA